MEIKKNLKGKEIKRTLRSVSIGGRRRVKKEWKNESRVDECIKVFIQR